MRASRVSPRLGPGARRACELCWHLPLFQQPGSQHTGACSSRGQESAGAVPGARVDLVQPCLEARPDQRRLRHDDLRAALHLRAAPRPPREQARQLLGQSMIAEGDGAWRRLAAGARAFAATRAARSVKGLATAHSDSARGSRPAARSAAAARSASSAPAARRAGAARSRSGWLPDTSSSASAAATPAARPPSARRPARCSSRASSAERERSCARRPRVTAPERGVSAGGGRRGRAPGRRRS